MAISKTQPMYQVFVEENGTPIPIFPKGPKEGCEMLVAAINKAIIDGAEKRWAAPYVALVK